MPEKSLLALHLEFKIGKQIGRSGPGDTLRLVHALRGVIASPANRYDRAIVLTTTPVKYLVGLLDSSAAGATLPNGDHGEGIFTIRYHGNGSESYSALSGTVDDSLLAAWLNSSGIDPAGVYDWVVSAYIGYSKAPRYLKVFDRFAVVQRIDLDYGRTGMGRKRWECHGSPDTSKRVLAVHVRNLASKEQNSPSWYAQAVREAAKARGYELLWYGAKDEEVFAWRVAGERVLPYGDLSYAEQIAQLQTSAGCAVGFNSGGLDLASAAGLPVLRAGEYQAGGCLGEEEPARKRNWGASYNSFLAVRTNVGLRPAWLEPERFSAECFVESLKSFLELAQDGRLNDPRHMILPWDEPLSSKNFGAQCELLEL